MKNTFLLLLLLLGASLKAQNSCSPYYPSTEGQTLVIHQLNKKGKLITASEHIVTQVSDSIINFQTKLRDKKGKEIVTGSFKVQCQNGITHLEPEAVVPAGQLQQYESMEYTISGSGLTFPNTLTVGETLDDGDISMEIDAAIMTLKMDIAMTDRKVIRTEEVTTPAGTFNCYVITYNNTLTMATSKTQFATQWITQGIGMVKQEMRKANGKLVSQSILHEIR